jgi:RimJ/RimL family protein N-acetyltransferase
MPEIRYPRPPLADELVRLRPWSEADDEPARRATQDPLIPRHTGVPENQTVLEIRRWRAEQEPARVSGESLFLVIADPRTDELLGSISLMRFEWADHRAEIGYWVAPWARRRGVATRSVRLLSRWALTDLGLGRVNLYTDPDNPASQAVAERCGFTREGVLRSYQERKGRRYDLVSFSLLPEDLG